jgi:hypothetical protein
VKHHVLKIFISVVSVRAPAAGLQINFHVAGNRLFIFKLQNRAAKIRPAFDADEAGMKNADGFSIGRFELVAAQALMLPDG